MSLGGIGSFGFNVTGATGATETISTLTAGAAVTSTTDHVGSIGTAVSIVENPVAGYATAVSCVDSRSAVTGNADITSNATAVDIPAANMKAGALWLCSYTNTKSPTLSLQKALGGSGRIAASDQFSLGGTGPGAPAAVTTTGTGGAIASAGYSITGTPGSAYTLSEATAAFDETLPRSISLVRTEDAERGASLIRDSVQKSLGTTTPTPSAPSTASPTCPRWARS